MILFFIALMTLSVTSAQEIKPEGEQVRIKWGRVSEENGIRKVVSTQEEYQAHNQHGPITYYHVPFTNGTFSLLWKRDLPKKINLVFQTEENGQPVHLFKVFINGTPTKNYEKTDVVSLVIYSPIPGSKKKKAKVTTKKYHAEAENWHKTSVTFKDSVATVRINDQTFSIEDERFRKKIARCGVGHIWGTLETKNVTIKKN